MSTEEEIHWLQFLLVIGRQHPDFRSYPMAQTVRVAVGGNRKEQITQRTGDGEREIFRVHYTPTPKVACEQLQRLNRNCWL